MRHIDFKALGIFVQAMRYGSIGRAAQVLGIRQPTVAYAIRKLHDVTGDELFFERRGTLVPTAFGLLLERAAPSRGTRCASACRWCWATRC